MECNNSDRFRDNPMNKCRLMRNIQEIPNIQLSIRAPNNDYSGSKRRETRTGDHSFLRHRH